jgi:glycoprotein endo-alpha-1,2-mannosidase
MEGSWMKRLVSLLAFLLALSLACSLPHTATALPRTGTALPSADLTNTAAPNLPPVTGPDPSYKVAAFYYPWYANPQTDGSWIHWEETNFSPPKDISSDYYPVLGAYSSKAPAAVAQHMVWLRQAGVGVIIVSWWGIGTHEDSAVPVIMKMAERYGIKVAFHIEPYSGRTAEGLVRDIQYLYKQYGSSPAFFRSGATTPYSPAAQPKGMFFVWCIGATDCRTQQVQADYWQKALDEIHALPESSLVIANTLDGSWINGGHFDGLYNYFSGNAAAGSDFAWAHSLPPGALYIPSVAPGFSGKRIADPPSTFVARGDGATYNEQWQAALGTGFPADMVTITSFNEWHEGTMIEPAAAGADNGAGYHYADFGKLPPDGYLTLTREWITKYLAMQWPPSYRARIQITTTSDWTTLNVVSGGAWIRPERISASLGVTTADIDGASRFALNQSLADANQGKSVEMTWDVLFSGLQPNGDLVLEIDRGNLGATQVTVFNYVGGTPVLVKTFHWGGVTSGRNADKVTIPAGALTSATPP